MAYVDRGHREDDSRSAVSITTGFIVNLGIATVAISMMLYVMQGPMTNLADDTKEKQLEVSSERIVSELERADRMARLGGDGEVRLDQPGVEYNVRFNDSVDPIEIDVYAEGVVVTSQYTGVTPIDPEDFDSSHPVVFDYEEDEIDVRIE